MIKLKDISGLYSVKKEMAYFMRRLYKQGLTTACGGNISLRYQDFILMTASQTDKGRMGSTEICELSLSGRPLNPEIKVSMEAAMHLAIYAARPDVTAIIHAHPPMASAHTVTYSAINTRLTAEAWIVLGEPVFADYALPGSEELAAQVAAKIGEAKVVLLKNHGALTVGNSLIQAFDRMEVLENTARIQLFAQLAGRPQQLSAADLEILNKTMNL